jgi:hypothetical protein
MGSKISLDFRLKFENEHNPGKKNWNLEFLNQGLKHPQKSRPATSTKYM